MLEGIFFPLMGCTILLLLLCGPFPVVYTARDLKENAKQAPPNSSTNLVDGVCVVSASWIPSVYEKNTVYGCIEGPFQVTMATNKTVDPKDLPVASLMYQWAYSYLHENKTDLMFHRLVTHPKIDRFSVDYSLAQTLGLNEDRFLRDPEIDKVFSDMLKNGYHVSNDLSEMIFELSEINGAIISAAGKDILLNMQHMHHN